MIGLLVGDIQQRIINDCLFVIVIVRMQFYKVWSNWQIDNYNSGHFEVNRSTKSNQPKNRLFKLSVSQHVPIIQNLGHSLLLINNTKVLAL
jgi:hypothetical protein